MSFRKFARLEVFFNCHSFLYCSLSVSFILLETVMNNGHPAEQEKLEEKRRAFYQSNEAVVQRCSVKKMSLEIWQNSQENTCARVSFSIKLQAEACNFIKKRLWHRCFPMNVAKFLRTPFYIEHLWRLLQKRMKIMRAKIRHIYQCQIFINQSRVSFLRQLK